MSRETNDQLDIIKSIKAEGGYAKKWASRFVVGVPDLVGALPGVGNFLMEVKKLGEKPTAKQEHELKLNTAAGGLSFLTIVEHKKFIRLHLYPDMISYLVCPWRDKRYMGIRHCMIKLAVVRRNFA